MVQEGKNFLSRGSAYRHFLTASIYGITGKVPSIVQSKMHFREKFLKTSPKRMPQTQMGFHPHYKHMLNQSSDENLGFEAIVTAHQMRSKSAME